LEMNCWRCFLGASFVFIAVVPFADYRTHN
jgi:hypothetical protein